MAAANGQPQDTPKPKKEITPEQKRTYGMLAVVGVLALIAGGIYIPGMLSGSSDTVAVTNTPPEGAPGAPGTNPVPGSPASPIASGAAGATTVTAPAGDPAAGATGAATAGAPSPADAGVPLRKSRPDPFQQAYLIPTPPPPLPPPVNVPGAVDDAPVNVPGSRVRLIDLNRPLNLPPVTIARLDESTRRPVDAFPPRRSSSEDGGGSISPSFDKRLSGVVIGDGVRALLEIQTSTGFVTRNVQPGDEVDGITVLNIQRFNDGQKTVTRMTIRENGEEKTVDLRASPAPVGGAGGLGAPGAPGLLGAPGGFPVQ